MAGVISEGCAGGVLWYASKQPGSCLASVCWCLMLTHLYGPEFVRPRIEADLFRGIQMGEACFHTVSPPSFCYTCRMLLILP